MRERHEGKSSGKAGGAQEEPAATEPAGAKRRRPEGDAERTTGEAGRAESVTRPAHLSERVEWLPLAWGFDSLDVGLFVEWGKFWPEFVKMFDRAKERACGTPGAVAKDHSAVMFPSGKPPAYRWHLGYPPFHLFIAKSEKPHGETPNVFASINSETLWRHGPEQSIGLVIAEVEAFGGTVAGLKVSRCDLASDFLVRGGVSLDFLRERRCPRHVSHEHHMAADRLETFYQGSKSALIRCRIYDKGLEVGLGGKKLWFKEIWDRESLEDVWRVEFQVRREALRELGIDTVSDLVRLKGKLWAYLTEKWFSLRETGPEHATRRALSPEWLAVQSSIGSVEERLLRCSQSEYPADVSWYVSHVSGCLTGYAAGKEIGAADRAADALAQEMKAYWKGRDFASAYARKRIGLGRPANGAETQSVADAA